MDPSIKPPVIVHDLSSDDERDDYDDLTVYSHVNGVNSARDITALDGSQDEEGGDDELDVDSLMEDIIEELGDEHLFNGGELSKPQKTSTLTVLDNALKVDNKTRTRRLYS